MHNNSFEAFLKAVSQSEGLEREGRTRREWMKGRRWEGGYLKDEGRKRVIQVIHSGFCLTALEKAWG